MRTVVAAALVILLAGLAFAEDRLTLRDGQVVTGKILSTTEGDVTIQVGDEKMRVPRWAIEKIERLDEKGRTATVKGTQKAGSRPGKKRREPPPPLADRDFPAATPELLAWIDLCVQHLGSEDAGVRAGARAALRTTGPAARPALEQAVAGDNAVAASEANGMLTYLKGLENRMRKRKVHRAEARAASPAEVMSEMLGLSEEQMPEFKAAVVHYYKQQALVAESVREGRMEADGAGKRIAELREELETELASVLTEEQMEQYRQKVPQPAGAAAQP